MSESNEDAGKPETKGERQELPSWDRSRSKRKANVRAEAEGDAFTRGVVEAGRSAQQRSKLLAGLLVVSVAAVGAVVWWQQRDTESKVEATRKLSEAVAWAARSQKVTAEQVEAIPSPPNPVYLEQSERDAALEAALAAAKGSDEVEVAALAELVASAEAFRAGEHDAALAGYERFLGSHAADHPFAFLAREGKGLALEAKGDLEGALANFEAMTAEGQADRFYADVALWHQGRLLERLERPADAVAVYKRYLETYPEGTRSSIALEDVKARLRELDAPNAESANEVAPADPSGSEAP